jgi:hypothetical protein
VKLPAAVSDIAARLRRYEALRCAVADDAGGTMPEDLGAFMRVGLATWLVGAAPPVDESGGAAIARRRTAACVATTTEFVAVLTDMTLAVAVAGREVLS